VLYGKRERLEALRPYKLRPAPESLPGRWMTGTACHEGIVGAAEAVRYLEDIGRSLHSEVENGRAALEFAYDAIQQIERDLCRWLLAGLAELPRIRIWGIADPDRLTERVPTVSLTHESKTPRELARALAERGLFAWPGNHYALPLTEALGLEPLGTLRIGLLHYNTAEEVDWLLAALTELV
jgi:selenocysteine lyase/cysteine desulfurase